MWWYRLVAGIGVAAAALVIWVGQAQAGGWAVTTIDALPDGGFHTGQTYRIGYTIRQHGQTPFDGAKTDITIVDRSNGDRYVFPGVPDGRAGHYVAEVTFPSEGAWEWEVSQYPFAVQTLGTIAVAPPAIADPGNGMQASLADQDTVTTPLDVLGVQSGSQSWQFLLLLLVLLITVGLAVQPLSRLARRRNPASASATPARRA